MIAPQAVQAFLNRPLRDSRIAKRLSVEAADKMIDDLKPHWHTQPLYLHQKITFLLGAKHKRYLLLLSMGLGKTWISLALFQLAIRRWQQSDRKQPKPRALVLVPGTSNVGQWEDECFKHVPFLAVQGVTATGAANRMIQVNGTADIVVSTYAGFLGLVCSGKGENEKGWAIDKKKLKVFQQQFDFLVMDEITAAKNHRSLTFKACKAVSWSCEYAYGLTGTPFGKDPADLWALFNVIDKGETLGDTLGMFREALFCKKEDYWSGFKFVFDKRKQGALERMICHNSIRFDDSSVVDLPPLIEIIRPVTFTEENWVYYDRLAQELKEARGFDATSSAFMRLRCITAGYLPIVDKEGGKVSYPFANNPKLEELLEVINEIPPDKKIVVFNEYKMSGDLICEALKKRKIPHERLYSGTSANDKRTTAQRLAKTRVLVSSSAGAFGQNLQASHYNIWFERPCSGILYQQERKRSHRIGQKHTVYLIDLCVKDSVDARIIESHVEGKNLFDAIIEGKRRAKLL